MRTISNDDDDVDESCMRTLQLVVFAPSVKKIELVDRDRCALFIRSRSLGPCNAYRPIQQHHASQSLAPCTSHAPRGELLSVQDFARPDGQWRSKALRSPGSTVTCGLSLSLPSTSPPFPSPPFPPLPQPSPSTCHEVAPKSS